MLSAPVCESDGMATTRTNPPQGSSEGRPGVSSRAALTHFPRLCEKSPACKGCKPGQLMGVREKAFDPAHFFYPANTTTS